MGAFTVPCIQRHPPVKTHTHTNCCSKLTLKHGRDEIRSTLRVVCVCFGMWTSACLQCAPSPHTPTGVRDREKRRNVEGERERVWVRQGKEGEAMRLRDVVEG